MNYNKMTFTIFILSLFTAAAFAAAAAPSAAQGVSATTTEFSAQQQQKTDDKNTPQVHRAPARTAPGVTTTPGTPGKLGTMQQKGPVTGGPKAVTPKVTGPKVGGPKVVGPKIAGPKAAKVFTPHGPKSTTIVLHSRLRGFPAHGAGRAVIGGRNYSVWRGGYRVRHDGAWRTFVALSALTAIVIGANEFYPYAYISAPEPYCEGLTEDGCQLVWEDVETVEGDIIPQCVAYCPWQ